MFGFGIAWGFWDEIRLALALRHWEEGTTLGLSGPHFRMLITAHHKGTCTGF